MKRTFLSLFAAFAVFLLTSCHQRTPHEPLAETPAATRYAELLDMQDLDDGHTLCRITNPWQRNHTVMQYLLIPEADSLVTDEYLTHIESLYGPVQTLSIPVRQHTITSACYAYLYDLLDADQYIGAMCDTEYVQDSVIASALRSGRIADAGSSMSPNAEVTLAKLF